MPAAWGGRVPPDTAGVRAADMLSCAGAAIALPVHLSGISI